jgi:hypothetical protein
MIIDRTFWRHGERQSYNGHMTTRHVELDNLIAFGESDVSLG